jgi:hypothetical protein
VPRRTAVVHGRGRRSGSGLRRRRYSLHRLGIGHHRRFRHHYITRGDHCSNVAGVVCCTSSAQYVIAAAMDTEEDGMAEVGTGKTESLLVSVSWRGFSDCSLLCRIYYAAPGYGYAPAPAPTTWYWCDPTPAVLPICAKLPDCVAAIVQ